MRWIVFAVCLASVFAATSVAAERPNVLVIVTDDMRWDCLSCAGHPYLQTPHLDRLAREGVRFRNAFCTTSLCSPSRACILSGQYAHRHKVTNNFTEYPVDLPSYPARLQQAGYKTAYIGKWHMGEENDDIRPGFDHFVTHRGQGKYFDTEFRANGGERKVVPGYYTHVVTRMALDWIKGQSDGASPWALILGHKAPHSFYIPEPKYAEAFAKADVPYPASAFQLDDKPEWFKLRLKTWHGIYGPLFDFRKEFPDTRPEGVTAFANMVRAYWATIISVDDSVGQIYAALEAAGTLDNTIIVFTADNGILNGEHGMIDKRTMHEPSIRVPLLVRYPQLGARAGSIVDRMVLHQDLAPSLLELCGAAPLENIAGRSWVKLARGEATPWRTSWFYEYNFEKQFPYTPNVRGVRTDRWKFVRSPEPGGRPDRYKAELYDLERDPDESRNLIADPAHADRVKELSAELDRLLTEAGPAAREMPADAIIEDRLPDLKIR